MTAPTIQRDAAYPDYAVFRQGDIEVTAAPAISPADEAYISGNIRDAAEYRRLNRHAQGMGYPSANDALAAHAKALARLKMMQKYLSPADYEAFEREWGKHVPDVSNLKWGAQ